MRKLLIFSVCLAVCHAPFAQPTAKPDAAGIYRQIQKLNFLGSVLYIAAHPDDENTRLITYFANDVHARTGYLSMTRGDGGQDLIGPELRELLGVIRTQELLRARRIDGGEQFFTRANDFGFSKNPDETLRIWNRDSVLSDVVWAIRRFRPDVIVNRFDARTPGSTHGHHTASAILATEAFRLAADPGAFPDELKYTTTWQPRRQYFNTSWWFYGGRDQFEKADKSNLAQLQTGVYYPTRGQSNQEIAALSRSQHQSQGFGSSGERGQDTEYLEFLQGDAPVSKSDLFAGIDTSWNRVPGGKAIGQILENVQERFDFTDPAASIPDLLRAYKLILTLGDPYWRDLKSGEIKNIIVACAGLYLEVSAKAGEATPGSDMTFRLEAINRSETEARLDGVDFLFGEDRANPHVEASGLENNVDRTQDISVRIPENAPYSRPYWLIEKATAGMYAVPDRRDIGLPEKHTAKAIFRLMIQGTQIDVTRDIVYKRTDPVKGEITQPFAIVPDLTLDFTAQTEVFADRHKTVTVAAVAGRDDISGTVALTMPEGWQVSPASAGLSLAAKGDKQVLSFEVTAPKESSDIVARAVATVGGKSFSLSRTDIDYPHIPKQIVLQAAQARFQHINLKTGHEKIAYIMGAGDEVDRCLKQMGYRVTLLKPQDITAEKLSGFDVVMTGIRAYNTVDALREKQPVLLDFVRSGHTMIVQYNTPTGMVTDDLAPYPLHISRDRVTEENAPVTFLSPGSRALSKPNKLGADDFTGWTQEQGLYYPDTWDARFQPVISAHDTGETPKNGAILIAPYGKGYYIYTGLSFFRQLPEGVPGAMRLMANLISIGN